jgi:hypothetical protein
MAGIKELGRKDEERGRGDGRKKGRRKEEERKEEEDMNVKKEGEEGKGC